MQISAKFFVISLLSVACVVKARISDFRLCADEKCSVPVSIARSVLSYNSDDARILSFRPSETITVYSKSAGNRPDLWGAEIGGKRGYVPKDFLREQKILHSNLKFEVPTEFGDETDVKENSVEAEPIENFGGKSETPFAPTPLPDKAEEPQENDPNLIVVDGTTIYMPEDAEIEKTVSQTQQPRAVPSLPPPDAMPPSVGLTQPDVPKAAALVEEIPIEAAVPAESEHTTPTPEAPPVEQEDASNEIDDGSIEAASEPPEVAKEEPVLGYLDTLTNWMENSGSGEADDGEADVDETDTGQSQEEQSAEDSTETVTPEPPETKKEEAVDLSKINLLSLKPGVKSPPEVQADSLLSVDEPSEKLVDSAEKVEEASDIVAEATEVPPVTEEVPFAPPTIPEEPPVPTLPNEYSDPYNTMSSDEINHQYSSYPSVQPVDDIASNTTEETPITENQLVEEVSTEAPSSAEVSTEAPSSAEVSTEAPSSAEVITEVAPVTEEIPVLAEVEILTPVQQPEQNEVEPVVEQITEVPYDPYKTVEIGQSWEGTTGVPAEDVYSPVTEEATTPYTSEEDVPPTGDQVEETTTSAPEGIPEEAVDEGSGRYFADWVYNLFGSSKTEEVSETTTQSELDMLLTEEPAAEVEATTISSWFWSTPAPEETKPLDGACAADSEGCAAAVESGVDPSSRASSPADYQPPHQPSVTEQVSTMEWDVASSGTLLYLTVTAVTVLLFTLGHYYIEKMRRDGALIAKINLLQKELMVSTKECQILRDDLENTKDKMTDIETTTSDSSEAVAEIQVELNESQRVCQEQEEQIKSLEMELEAATEAGLELNKMLSEFLSTQRGSEDLVKSVELLQSQLNKQQTTISTMNQALNAKTEENETLRAELNLANDKASNLEMEVGSVSSTLSELQMENERLEQELDNNTSSTANQLQEAANLREMEVDAMKKKLEASEAALAEVQNSLRYRNSELEVLKESISKLEQLTDDNKGKASKKLEAMLDVSKAQAELKLLRSERDVLKERLQCEEDARQLLEDHVKVIKGEVEKLHEKGESSEREKQDALTRLEVLSDYFKEKEAQLQKELGLQEAICVMKNEDVSVTHSKIKSMQEEINSFKAQNETLKQEILDQERSLKSQVTTLEKKAHDNWIAARHAERKLEETKQESSTLRNRLTLLEKGPSLVTQNGEDGKGPTQRLLESNGELPTSPALHIGDSPTMSPHYMLPPPPLGAFMPPPPPPEYMQSPPPPLYPDRRPPPLGRMSSPPPPHHFSPPPSDRYNSPYRPRSPGSDRSLPRYRYGSRSPSPPPYGAGDYPPYHSAGRPWEEPRAGFRPVPRDKDMKGSNVSSGHSSSDSVGKSSSHRSGKRGK